MDNYLFISDAAKEVKVESHVLRYWEEELHLPIKRNELGHRYYTEEDVERFKQIKGMKERGLQLKAIKMILKDGKLDMLVPRQRTGDGTDKSETAGKSSGAGGEWNTDQIMRQNMAQSARQDRRQNAAENMAQGAERPVAPGRTQNTAQATGRNIQPANMPIDIVETKETGISTADSKEDKSRRLQWLLQQLIRETLQENNSELCREIKESVVKELDYQFRMQEEREEARDKLLVERSEEHYQKMDELLRKKAKKKILREKAREKKEQETEKEFLELSGGSISKDNILGENPKEKTEKKKKRFIF